MGWGRSATVRRDVKVLQRLQQIAHQMRDESGAFGIVTKQRRCLHFQLARNNFRASRGARLHRWEDLVCVTELALQQAHVNVGPVVYEQRRGVPIQGFRSKQSIFLGYPEAQWLTSGNAACCPLCLSFEQTIAAVRYVDDLAMASSVSCSACVGSMVTQIATHSV